MEHKSEASRKICDCPHHKMLPLLTILVGVDFLLGALYIVPWRFVDITWPILVIIGGGTWLTQSNCTCC